MVVKNYLYQLGNGDILVSIDDNLSIEHCGYPYPDCTFRDAKGQSDVEYLLLGGRNIQYKYKELFMRILKTGVEIKLLKTVDDIYTLIYSKAVAAEDGCLDLSDFKDYDLSSFKMPVTKKDVKSVNSSEYLLFAVEQLRCSINEDKKLTFNTAYRRWLTLYNLCDSLSLVPLSYTHNSGSSYLFYIKYTTYSKEYTSEATSFANEFCQAISRYAIPYIFQFDGSYYVVCDLSIIDSPKKDVILYNVLMHSRIRGRVNYRDTIYSENIGDLTRIYNMSRIDLQTAYNNLSYLQESTALKIRRLYGMLANTDDVISEGYDTSLTEKLIEFKENGQLKIDSSIGFHLLERLEVRRYSADAHKDTEYDIDLILGDFTIKYYNTEV